VHAVFVMWHWAQEHSSAVPWDPLRPPSLPLAALSCNPSPGGATSDSLPNLYMWPHPAQTPLAPTVNAQPSSHLLAYPSPHSSNIRLPGCPCTRPSAVRRIAGGIAAVIVAPTAADHTVGSL
jgi:hypothetical protein